MTVTSHQTLAVIEKVRRFAMPERAMVQFNIGEDGRVLRASAPSRPRIVGKTVVNTAWSGVFSDHGEFGGVRVPTQAEVSWDLRDGPFTYWRGRVTEFSLRR